MIHGTICLAPDLSSIFPFHRLRIQYSARDFIGLIVDHRICWVLWWVLFYKIASSTSPLSDSPIQSINLVPWPSAQLSTTGWAEPLLHSPDLPGSPALAAFLEAPSSPMSFTCSLPCSCTHHRQRNVPSGISSRCSLLWSLPHLISHLVLFVWKMGFWYGNLRSQFNWKIRKTWCPGHCWRIDWSNSPF